MGFQDLPLNKSLLIYGPPDTGKASFLRSLPQFQDVLYMDLDDPLLVREIINKTDFIHDILAEVKPGEWITINRIDRITKYLPLLVESIRTGKILIAATTSTLFPFESLLDSFIVHHCTSMNNSQIKGSLKLVQILSFGTLPKVYNMEKDVDKIRYLKNYLQDFLDMEILAKSLIRNLVPFHLFLPLAAQCSGHRINYSSIAQDLEVDYKTIQNYFDILVSYRVGFFLKAYAKQIKKVQQKSPRFYFFDMGFHRSVENKLDSILIENSEEYHQLFKIFCINELQKINEVKKINCHFSYLETKDGVSVDLIIEKPDGSTDLLVFVTATKILPKHLKQLKNIGKSLPEARLICVTNSKMQSELAQVSLIYYESIDSILA